MDDSERLKSVLSVIFRRKGGAGQFTSLFESLGSEKKEVLLSQIKLNDGEVPLVASVENSAQWLLITSERLLWRSDAGVRVLSLSNVRDVVVDLSALPSAHLKSQLSELQLTTISNEKYMLMMEAGPPLIGVWHILLFISARNRRNSN